MTRNGWRVAIAVATFQNRSRPCAPESSVMRVLAVKRRRDIRSPDRGQDWRHDPMRRTIGIAVRGRWKRADWAQASRLQPLPRGNRDGCAPVVVLAHLRWP